VLLEIALRIYNRFRIFLLSFYAKHEVSILATLFKLLHSKVIRIKPISEIIYLLLVYPAARWAISGVPVCPDELDYFLSNFENGRFAVGPCRCRIAHQSCSHPLETDIVIKEGFGIWKELFPQDYREISKEEALEICKSSHSLGMAQIAFRHMDIGSNQNFFVICNCCPDGCLPLLSFKFYGEKKYPFRKGKKEAQVKKELCKGCGKCIEVCPFGSRVILNNVAVVRNCYGCGLCASFCPEGASVMVRRGVRIGRKP